MRAAWTESRDPEGPRFLFRLWYTLLPGKRGSIILSTASYLLGDTWGAYGTVWQARRKHGVVDRWTPGSLLVAALVYSTRTGEARTVRVRGELEDVE